MHSWRVRAALCLTALLAVTAAIVSVGPARAAVESFLACASTSPCLEWDNSKSGDAIKGVSSNGTALEGRTQFTSAGQKAGKSGVLGADVSKSGSLNSGVIGTSINGTGVTGMTTGSSAVNGVAGLSSSTGGSGVYGQNSSTGIGVVGRSTATAHNNGAAGVLADGGSSNDGLHATSTSANAVYAFAQTGTALFANQGPNTSAPELYLQDTSSSNNKIIQAVGMSGDVFDVDSLGNVVVGASLRVGPELGTSTVVNVPGNLNPTLLVYAGGKNNGITSFGVLDELGGTDMAVTDRGDVTIAGLIYTQGQCKNGCVVGDKRVRGVTEYAPLESEPTIEDNGEATLAGGFAYVPLDPKFANVMDKNASYLVSVTPEGDCNGLFVAQRTPNGFAVRELRNGRGKINFEYRIVAKRYGVHAQRLPMTDVISLPPSRRLPHA